MGLITKILADYLLFPMLAIFVVVVFRYKPKRGLYDKLTRVIMAGLSSYVLAKFIAFAWQPSARRPFEDMGVEAGASSLNNPGFPSDHALFATFLVYAVWYLTKSTRLTVVMVVLAILTMLGRVLALVHTPLDVIGGFVIASVGAIWYLNKTSK